MLLQASDRSFSGAFPTACDKQVEVSPDTPSLGAGAASLAMGGIASRGGGEITPIVFKNSSDSTRRLRRDGEELDVRKRALDCN